MAEPRMPWPHAPSHQLGVAGTYFVTASTYEKAHHFRGASRLRVLQRGLLQLTQDHGWRLEAWAVFSNHYHFVAHSPLDADSAESVATIMKTLHAKTAAWVNRLDRAPVRKVWFNYRDTLLTHSGSYFARLKYTHQNPVKHGLVPVASLYPWCSAAWFERTASPAQVRSVYRLRVDRVAVPDDFEPDPDWGE